MAVLISIASVIAIIRTVTTISMYIITLQEISVPSDHVGRVLAQWASILMFFRLHRVCTVALNFLKRIGEHKCSPKCVNGLVRRFAPMPALDVGL